MHLESHFQRQFLNRVKELFPHCIVLKNDPNYMQGVPDFVVFFGPHYAMLEFKRYQSAARQANQQYYIDLFRGWSYAAFVHPSNAEEVLDELQRTFGTRR